MIRSLAPFLDYICSFALQRSAKEKAEKDAAELQKRLQAQWTRRPSGHPEAFLVACVKAANSSVEEMKAKLAEQELAISKAHWSPV